MLLTFIKLLELEVMVFGALLGAFGEALIWTSSPVYINYLLHEYWEKQKDLDKSLTEDMMRNKWLAKYLVILKFSLVNFYSKLTCLKLRLIFVVCCFFEVMVNTLNFFHCEKN